MRPKESGFDDKRAVVHDRASNPQHPQLCLGIEAIAGFDLDCSHALGNQDIDAQQGISQQLFFARRTGYFDGGCDTTTGACDLFVGGAIQAPSGVVDDARLEWRELLCSHRR